MLILLGEQYVNPEHIVEVVMHPGGNGVCVLLTNGGEVRIERNQGEGKPEALTRVVQYIRAVESQRQ